MPLSGRNSKRAKLVLMIPAHLIKVGIFFKLKLALYQQALYCFGEKMARYMLQVCYRIILLLLVQIEFLLNLAYCTISSSKV